MSDALPNSQPFTDTLPAGYTLTVTAPPGASALVERVDISGALTKKEVIGTKVFGPYQQPSSIAVTAFGAACSISKTAADADIGALILNGGTTTQPLRKARTALAKVRAGLGNMTIAFVGDSTFGGAYANGATVWANNKAISAPSAFAATLKATGLNTCLGSVIADNSVLAHGGTLNSYDPRLTVGSKWVMGGVSCPGGQMLQVSNGTLGTTPQETFSFAPVDSFDTVEVYWYRSGSSGTFTIDCGGAVLATCGSGATGVVKTVVTKTAGVGLVNLIRTVATNINVLGINTYLSTAKTVNVLNMGWAGAKTSDWNNSTALYSPLSAITAYAADLHIINLTINDAIAGRSQAAIAADLDAIVAGCLTVGDVLLMVTTPVGTGVATAANQLVAANAVNQVAQSRSLPVLDMSARWGSFTIANGLGYFFTDQTHPVQLGYQDVATAVANYLLTA